MRLYEKGVRCPIISKHLALRSLSISYVFIYKNNSMDTQHPLIEWAKPPKKKKKWFYNKYDLTSLLIKSMRIGDEKLAIKTMRCMLNEWIPELYIARKCVHRSSEDWVSPRIFNYAKNIHDWIRDCGSEINSLSRLIIELCNAPKFRETRKEADREVWRIHIREETKKQYKEWIKPLELPERVFDRYTSRWKSALNRWEKIDIRYSGVLHGWIHMRKQFLSKKKLDPQNSTLSDAYDMDIMEALEMGLSYDKRMDQACSK